MQFDCDFCHPIPRFNFVHGDETVGQILSDDNLSFRNATDWTSVNSHLIFIRCSGGLELVPRGEDEAGRVVPLAAAPHPRLQRLPHQPRPGARHRAARGGCPGCFLLHY